MKYEDLAKDIIENVGGKENISSVVHCITRLRFKLKDESKANTDYLMNHDEIVTVRQSGGQYQVVIGNHVPEVYQAVVAVGGFESASSNDQNEGVKGSIFNQFIEIISGIFQPILAVLVASGMIKGFNALFVALGWLSDTDGTYAILNAIGDGLFYFLPIFLGYTSMKKFGGSPFLGMVIASALVYPALDPTLGGLTAGEPLYTLFTGTLFESNVHLEFLGIPVILMTYAMSVIPIIVANYFAAKLENALAKVIPDVIKTFVVPMLTMLIIIPVTFIVIGPIATWASQLLGQGTIWIYELSPIVAGAFLGGLWLVFVMFGLHWGLVPIALNNFAGQGWDPILALIFAHSFALAGAISAIWIRTKSEKIKSLSFPAILSSIFGVTEPGMYGLALPLKKPFIYTLISSAIGGAIIGMFGTVGHNMAGLGIFQWASFVHPEEGLNTAFFGSVVAVVVATILAFVLTYFFGGINKTEQDSNQATSSVGEGGIQSEIIESPLTGEVINLADTSDTAFASGALGRGVAIIPSEGKLVSPVNGKISALFGTNHAIGIETEQGAEVLVHIGIDTVQLNGEFFKAYVSQGDNVKKGQLLIEFDIEGIKSAGYDTVTPVVVTNDQEYTRVEAVKLGETTIGEPILDLER